MFSQKKKITLLYPKILPCRMMQNIFILPLTIPFTEHNGKKYLKPATPLVADMSSDILSRVLDFNNLT